MTIRRSSVVLIVIGVVLILLAALTRFVIVPHLSKLPEDTNDTATFNATLYQLDPASFALDAGTPFTVDRTLKVEQVEGDTAVVRDTAVSHLPTGDSTVSHTYAIDRGDYTQAAPPNGIVVEDQKGGMTVSFPNDPGTGAARIYDPVTQTAQPVTYQGTEDLAGREVYKFAGITTAPIADSNVLEPLKAGIAAMARSGDGSTLPKAMIEAMLPALPTDRAEPARQALTAASDQVPVSFTSANDMTVWVDSDFGAPFKAEQVQTTILNLAADGRTVPLLDMGRIEIVSSEESVNTAANALSNGDTQLTVLAVWIPLGITAIGLILIAIGIIRRTRPVGEAQNDDIRSEDGIVSTRR